MAKKQVFGDQALASKLAQRKMAKVILPKKNSAGTLSFHEAIIDQDRVQEFLAKNK